MRYTARPRGECTGVKRMRNGMKHWAGAAAILLAVTTGAFGQGGGALIYENGAPDMGSSYAGHSARADDALNGALGECPTPL